MAVWRQPQPSTSRVGDGSCAEVEWRISKFDGIGNQDFDDALFASVGVG